MVSIPPHLTAYQGFDAFFHAAEGFIANCSTPISDLYALEAIRLLAKYLPIAVSDGKNLKARAKVAWEAHWPASWNPLPAVLLNIPWNMP